MSPTPLVSVLQAHLERLYDPPDVRRALPALLELCDGFPGGPRNGELTERDVWLIAYADHVEDEGMRPLQAMASLLAEDLDDVVNGVHLLPFFPSTSDDGFAVVDHLSVDPAVGTWQDVEQIGADRRLMVDAVVNHVSASNRWVVEWSAGTRDGWVLEVPDRVDTSEVVRPRTSPLFSPFEAPDGRPRWAWTTFGPDQVDLDYRNPDVLIAMTEVLLGYAAHGAGVIRLDAVGFLWKASGTRCIHLPQTHEVIRLWRSVLEACAPGTMLVTETNVPHAENVSYFGNGTDEAHLVYQFPLAPLVLAAFTWGNAQDLTRWAASLEDPAPGTAFLNLLGSHDGIGMRPAEGLLSPAQAEGLCDLARAAGGGVSYRANPDGSQTPYELNTTYIDALTAVADDGRGVARIAAAHAILLALRGVPGIWFGALFGVPNDPDLVRRTGRLRSVNRARLDLEDLRDDLARPGSRRQVIFGSLSRLIALRRAHPAFSPASPQLILPTPGWLFAVVRGAPGTRVVVIVSVSDRDRRVEPACLVGEGAWSDRLGAADAEPVTRDDPLILPPYGVAWLEEV